MQNDEWFGADASWGLISAFSLLCFLRLQLFQFVAVFSVFHRPAGGGDFGAESVGGGEIAGLFGGPALSGEGGDFGGGDGRFRRTGGEVEAEGKKDAIEGGCVDPGRTAV